MQLKRLVLPAPLGPISASSSPAAASNETLCSTRRPPNASEMSWTSSSAMVRPRQSLVPRVAIAAPGAARAAEIVFLDARVGAHGGAVAFHGDFAVFQNVGVIRHLQRDDRILLDQDERQPELLFDLAQPFHQLRDDHRRE